MSLRSHLAALSETTLIDMAGTRRVGRIYVVPACHAAAHTQRLDRVVQALDCRFCPLVTCQQRRLRQGPHSPALKPKACLQ